MKYEGGFDDLLVLAAFRYALGRQTYLVHHVQEFLREVWLDLPETARAVIKRDIREAAARGEPNSDRSGLGHVRIDEPGWLDVLMWPGGDDDL